MSNLIDSVRSYILTCPFLSDGRVRMNPETPRRTGVLVKSATLGTVIGSGEINQIAPYARRQYYEHKEKSRWFERMKNRHKDSILKGAAKYVKSH